MIIPCITDLLINPHMFSVFSPSVPQLDQRFGFFLACVALLACASHVQDVSLEVLESGCSGAQAVLNDTQCVATSMRTLKFEGSRFWRCVARRFQFSLPEFRFGLWSLFGLGQDWWYSSIVLSFLSQSTQEVSFWAKPRRDVEFESFDAMKSCRRFPV